MAEVVVFDYGVAVFTGFDETEERLILEDLSSVSHQHPRSIAGLAG